MSIWATAGAAIDAVFADPEPIVYTGAGLVAVPIAAIRLDELAPDFDGQGRTARRVGYELPFSAMPGTPAKGQYFTHRGFRWNVQQAERRDEIGKWHLDVTQGPPA